MILEMIFFSRHGAIENDKLDKKSLEIPDTFRKAVQWWSGCTEEPFRKILLGDLLLMQINDIANEIEALSDILNSSGVSKEYASDSLKEVLAREDTFPEIVLSAHLVTTQFSDFLNEVINTK